MRSKIFSLHAVTEQSAIYGQESIANEKISFRVSLPRYILNILLILQINRIILLIRDLLPRSVKE